MSLAEQELNSLSGSEIANLRHELRTPVNQIVGYCEMLLEDAESQNRLQRQQPLTETLAAVREVLALIDAALPQTLTAIGRDRILSLYESLHNPQTRIIGAMSGLLHAEGGSSDKEFVADVCRIRDAAERLLPTDRPRAEPTAAFSAPSVVHVAPSAAPGAKPGMRARILVVDDIEANRGVLERRLTREGHTVVCAVSGRDALT